MKIETSFPHPLLKKTIIGLCIYIYWSLLAIVEVLERPFGAFQLVRYGTSPDNLASSIWAEIIAAYFSPFAIINLTLLSLIFWASAKIRKRLAGYFWLQNAEQVTGAHPSSSHEEGEERTSHAVHKIFASRTHFEIPPNCAVIVEKKSGDVEAVMGTSERKMHTPIDEYSRIIEIIPLEAHSIKISFDTPKKSEKEPDRDYILTFGFPTIPSKREQEISRIDPASLIAIHKQGNFSHWRSLVKLCIFSGLQKLGFEITNSKGENHIYLKQTPYENFEGEKESQELTNKTARRNRTPFYFSGSQFAFSLKKVVHRNRKFSRAPILVQSAFENKNNASKPDEENGLNVKQLQKDLSGYINTVLNQIYQYPVVEMKILEKEHEASTSKRYSSDSR